jgi:N-acetylneuraminic acid mutarotase
VEQRAHAFPRAGANALVAYARQLYLVGGSTDGHRGGFQAWFDRYDPVANAWQELPDAPHARDHVQAAVIGDKLYVAGGRTTSEATGNVVNLTVPQVDVYDFAAAKWSTLTAMLPTPRAGNSTVAVGNWLLVIGGESNMPMAHGQVEALNTLDGAFTSFAELVQERHATGAAWLEGRLYTAQGAGAQGGGPELTSIEVWE